MNNKPRKRHGLLYYYFWTAVTVSAFWYLGAMFAQYLAS